MPLDPAARATFAELWDDAWNDGLWAAPWRASIEDLSAQQAAWTPALDRHSIWQIVLHMIFWRESWLKRAAGGPRHTDEEQERLNFPDITDTSEAAWATACQRFADTQSRIAEALRNSDPATDPLTYFLPHDCYHFGQIAYLRAMQGLPPID
jgi:uncharacterized damage-inducible protein DinB